MGTTVQTTALETTRTAFGLLQSLSGVLPGPANVVVALGQHIVSIIDVRPAIRPAARNLSAVLSQDINTNEELCETIRERTSRLVLVVTMKQEKVKDEDIPQSVKDQMRDLCTFVLAISYLISPLTFALSKLTNIVRRLENIRSKTPVKGLGRFIQKIVFRKDIAGSLQKCASDLDWELRAFEVSSDHTVALIPKLTACRGRRRAGKRHAESRNGSRDGRCPG